MKLHFSETLLASEKAALASGIDKFADAITIVRDVSGRIRLIVEIKFGVALEGLAECQRAKDELKLKLEDYFGGIEFLTIKETRSDKIILDLIAKTRQKREAPPGSPCSQWYLLERRLSKNSWFEKQNPPWPLPTLQKPAPLIASFYSFKGGVGRTTALAAVAINLSRVGKRVVIIDLDLEAPGLGSLMQGRTTYGALDYLFEHPVLGRAETLDPYCSLQTEQKFILTGEAIRVIPAGVLNEEYIEKLSRLNFLTQQQDNGGSVASALSDLLIQCRDAFGAEYILLDARAGIHDIGGLALHGMSHVNILFGRASPQSYEGYSLILPELGRLNVQQGEDAPLCLPVHAFAPPAGDQNRETEIENFRSTIYDLFVNNYYPSEDDIPDINDSEAEHFPSVLSWNPSLARFTDLTDVVEYLTQGEYSDLAERLAGIRGDSLSRRQSSP